MLFLFLYNAFPIVQPLLQLEKMCVHRTLMPPPSVLSKIAPGLDCTNGWKTRSIYRTIPEADPKAKL